MNPFPLCHANSGATVTIASLSGGGRARSRLYALGLTPGTQLQVTSSGPGPCRMKVRDSQLVLGQGLAAKIMVFPSP